ncbi:MAG: hypothetical protein IT371_09225 [Deltaproteobacteria bacterium]|nr:hypothetical protein [Deltaproteobacteria bacterium]
MSLLLLALSGCGDAPLAISSKKAATWHLTTCTPTDGIPFRLTHREFETRHPYQGNGGWYQNNQVARTDILVSPAVATMTFGMPVLNYIEVLWDNLTLEHATGPGYSEFTGYFGPWGLGPYAPLRSQSGATGRYRLIFTTDTSVSGFQGWTLENVTATCVQDVQQPRAVEVLANEPYQGVLIGPTDAIYVKFWQRADSAYYVHVLRTTPTDLTRGFAPEVYIDPVQEADAGHALLGTHTPFTDCPIEERPGGCDVMRRVDPSGYDRWVYVTIRSSPNAFPAGGAGHFRLRINRQTTTNPPLPASGAIRVAVPPTNFTDVNNACNQMRVKNVRRSLLAAAQAYYGFTNGTSLIPRFYLHWNVQDVGAFSTAHKDSLVVDNPGGAVLPANAEGYCRVLGHRANRTAIAESNFGCNGQYYNGQYLYDDATKKQLQHAGTVMAHEWGHCLLWLQDEFRSSDGSPTCGHSLMHSAVFVSNDHNDYLAVACTSYNWGYSSAGDWNGGSERNWDHPRQLFWGEHLVSSWSRLLNDANLELYFGLDAPASPARYWPAHLSGIPRAGGYPFNRHVELYECTNQEMSSCSPSQWPDDTTMGQ